MTEVVRLAYVAPAKAGAYGWTAFRSA
ncbi:hypothetical protein SPHINGO8AM_180100 [Sphingomonas sp. 8AM]|nr:hypothetical protein SPHINGO8AM_180100 [Sphingomonas sp. 8AM]